MATTTIQASAQPKFSWDPEVPDTPFWADVPRYEVAGHFTRCFTPKELDALDLESKASLPRDDKIQVLRQLLQDKLQDKEEEVGPSGLRAANYVEWRHFYTAICCTEKQLGLPEAEDKLRFMVSHTPNGEPDVAAKMALVTYLIDKGDLEEAETLSTGILEYLETHPKLGRASPQVMGHVRNMIALKWKQGKVDEAKALIADAYKRIDEMAGTQFAKYVQEETDELKDVVKKLEASQ